MTVPVTFDETKRLRNQRKHGLDLRDAARVLDAWTLDRVDDREDYGEERIVSIGLLDSRLVVVVWTERPGERRVISMRRATPREQKSYWKEYGGL